MPWALFVLNVPNPNSSMLVLPSSSPPAFRSLRTGSASKGGLYPSSIFDPARAWKSFVHKLSFAENVNGWSPSGTVSSISQNALYLSLLRRSLWMSNLPVTRA